MRSIFSSLFELVKLVLIVVVVAFILRYFVMQPFVVEGQSMEPNFHDSELLIVEKVSYRLNEPQRGDVIVFRFPGSPNLNYIKRIVGLPGERVGIHDGAVFVNGKKVEEPYLNGEKTFAANLSGLGETTLTENEYFVLGDNRGHSSDSREWGVVPRANVVGKAFLVILPLGNFGLVPHARVSLSNPSTSLLLPSPSLRNTNDVRIYEYKLRSFVY